MPKRLSQFAFSFSFSHRVERFKWLIQEGGGFYSAEFDAREIAELREEFEIEEPAPRSFVVEDFGQLDWGGLWA